MIDTIEEINKQLEEIKYKEKYETIWNYFKDTGPYRRELYPKHLEFFRAGKFYKERLFLSANRTGKSISCSFEMSLHLTGQYDRYAPWWDGYRFDRPINAWACGTTSETTRNVNQRYLVGTSNDLGTGMIPKIYLNLNPRSKRGVSSFIDMIEVEHISGRYSTLQFKTYKSGRTVAEGDTVDLIWLDEECDLSYYSEAITRTATTKGKIMISFTPLQGLSELVLSFLPEQFSFTDTEKSKSKIAKDFVDIYG